MKNSSYSIIPLSKTRLHEEIVGQLKDKIINRQISPGEKLPSENELAEKFGVNRSTVREALNKLESMELVEIKHGSGVYVKDYLESGSLELVKQILLRDGSLNLATMKNLMDLRKLLVPEIAFQAALNRTDRDLSDLENVVGDGENLSMDERDWRVHNIIARASGNLLFVILLNAFTGLAREFSDAYFRDDVNKRRSDIFHKEIFQAIKNRKAEKAKTIMLDVLIYAEEATYKALNNE